MEELPCPLCSSYDVQRVRSVTVRQLVQGWRATYDIDVSGMLGNRESVLVYKCLNCHLSFCDPTLAAKDDLYSQLQRFDWYYMPRKWEHDAAAANMPNGVRVLEVGCGRGDFVQRLRNEKTCDAVGIELNGSAVAEARALGWQVEQLRVEEMGRRKPGAFDVVCSFQVLEHVPQPRGFLDACVTLLKPGGTLILGVPNNDGFLRHAGRELLNLPPHHVTLWNQASLSHISQLYPLRVEKIMYEPLASYHVNFYCGVYLRRVLAAKALHWTAYQLLARTLLPLVRATHVHRFLRGAGMYVSFSRTERA